MANDIVGWVLRLQESRGTPENVDVEGVEAALHELRERAAELEEAYAEPGSAPSEDERSILLDMAAALAGVADELERFLDSGAWHHVEQALERAMEMAALRNSLL